MSNEKLKQIVINVIKRFFEDVRGDTTSIVTDDTVLLGDDGILDSLGLIQVVVGIESHFNDLNQTIFLTSENAMSQENSPFRTVTSLVHFIAEQLQN